LDGIKRRSRKWQNATRNRISVYTLSFNYDAERKRNYQCFMRRERDTENQSDHLLGSKYEYLIVKDKKQQAC
jgi:hypothetical protein